ncbi:hypothetical protein B0H13DRAFT_1899429 [Mycena leptocephala]|nr:hypothetical protein B0H13DRAFT_1899429 [Mycena leptocephala]
MYGAASSGGIHATILHGDMIPFQHFLDLHLYSPVLTVYIRAFSRAEFTVRGSEVAVHIHHIVTGPAGLLLRVSDVPSRFIYESIQFDRECTFWICRSTGRLYADLIPDTFDSSHFGSYERRTLDLWRRISFLNVPHMEAMVIDSLTMEQFHAISRWDLARYQVKGSPTPATVRLGAISAASGHG